MRIAVVIPAYNEESSIGWTIRGIKELTYHGIPYSVVVVDDGSTDDTARVAKASGADIVYSHHINRGSGATTWTAIQIAVKAGYDVICRIDADGQFLPIEIGKVIEPIVEGKSDLAIGSRFYKGSSNRMVPTVKLIGNRLFSGLLSILVSKILQDTQSGFRALSRDAAKDLRLTGLFNSTQEMVLDLASKGYHISEVPVHVRYFVGRKSRVVRSTHTYIVKVIGLLMLKLLRIPKIAVGILLALCSTALAVFLLSVAGFL